MNIQMSEDVRALNPELKENPRITRNKYGNKPVYGYASTKEAHRAADLELMLKGGEIYALSNQVPFSLPGNTVYIADFVYLEMRDGKLSVVIEDVKGFRTKEYRLKKRLFREKYGQDIQEI